jgi:RNA polymerase sigma-70 factor (family 1)
MPVYQTSTDEELIVLLKAGNDDAFSEIYQRYSKLLYLYAFKKLQNKEEAKDVVQDVFIRLFKNRNELELKTTLSGYLYKSVLNKVFDIFKHQDIIRKYVENGYHFIEVDSQETDYLICEKEIASLIEQEIALMPPRMKEIYELKRKHFLTTKEISQRLELSEHTVSTQLKRAMKHLRHKLGLLVFVLYILHS